MNCLLYSSLQRFTHFLTLLQNINAEVRAIASFIANRHFKEFCSTCSSTASLLLRQAVSSVGHSIRDARAERAAARGEFANQPWNEWVSCALNRLFALVDMPVAVSFCYAMSVHNLAGACRCLRAWWQNCLHLRWSSFSVCRSELPFQCVSSAFMPCCESIVAFFKHTNNQVCPGRVQ